MSAVLRLARHYAAPPERVFDAWTHPDVLREWWAADRDWEGAEAEVDLRPGGRYRLGMRDTTTGAVHVVTGEYTEIDPPARLAYTWTWEGEPEVMRGSEGSLVEVEFLPDADGTLVLVTHSGFADERIRDMHGAGWTACLDNLERRALGRSRA